MVQLVQNKFNILSVDSQFHQITSIWTTNFLIRFIKVLFGIAKFFQIHQDAGSVEKN